MTDKQLLVNKIICPDGTELVSRHRHDFQYHRQEDGREYFTDGGLDYQRIGASDEEYTDCTCYVGDPIEKVREHFPWRSTLDKDSKPLDKPIFKLLKDLDDDHLEALISWTNKYSYPEFIVDLFKQEKEYRNEHSICV